MFVPPNTALKSQPLELLSPLLLVYLNLNRYKNPPLESRENLKLEQFLVHAQAYQSLTLVMKYTAPSPPKEHRLNQIEQVKDVA